MGALQPSYDDILNLIHETNHAIKATHENLIISQKEVEIRTKEIDRKIKAMTDSFGKLGNRLGEFVEDAVRPAAVRLFQERGIEAHEVHQNVSAIRGNEGLEIDLLVVNEQTIIAIVCKSQLRPEDIKNHIERLEKIKRLLPHYGHCRILGAVAAMVISNEVALYAERQGLFVIGQTGEHLALRNTPDFSPASW